MSDLIDRQKAIDALDRIFDRCEEIEAHLPEGDPDRTGYKMYPDYMTVWKFLRQLPSAEPETHGRWDIIDSVEPRTYGCSVCKKLSKYQENYCSWCGAKMDLEANDAD